MRYVHDKELKGHALLFDGPLEMVETARKACSLPTAPAMFRLPPTACHPGRTGKGWDQLVGFLHKPWPEAYKRVEYVQEKVRHGGLPTPKSVRRKPRWSETDGDVDVDRAMHGDPEFYRRVSREKVTGPTNIALITNLDSPYSVNESGLFYRSTALIAVTDILENLGYSVEVWMWCLGYGVFPSPDHHQFTACRMKEFGQPIDIHSMCDTLSAWFTSEVVFGTFPAVPGEAGRQCRYGSPIEAKNGAKTIPTVGMRGWEKYLDVSQGCLAIPVSMVKGSLDAAVGLAKEILENVIATQEGM